ncbi:AraC family transcriptional regulator [Paraburkholderia fungorum]|jgi:AraC family transcriptional regulator|uniref:helix-turn-helix domain-containing protein n=1 Tax=Paraburkholderia fungorum TaxID=134537 RepID=UPI0004864B01|nr:AraC family transcriptional regulator [Paraburkholderia fungorum]MBB5539939.1 AraC-like DNA-binding protein [Paraburkholderia fungorum]PNE53056.1 AraC family transcriptional regulator [Paraburkholderia fungorum]
MISSSTLYPDPAAEVVRKSWVSPIGKERQWRCPGGDHADTPQRGGILAARWTRNEAQPLEVVNPGSAAHHCIAMNLKCTSLTFAHAGKTLVRGRVTAGVAQITAPDVPCNAVFESPADVLHLFVSQQVLGECFEDMFGRPHAGEIRIDNPKLVRDPALERLGQALAVSQSDDAALGKVFTDSVSLAIVSRVIARHFTVAERQAREASALPSWRLSRAIEYVDAHLSESIGLADIANSTGLTRMHFASQFRRATGMRPHEYLLRRRIEHAQHLLLASKHNVLDVALSCGFRSQAHFTTVFKRLVGETPYCWRVKANVDR